MLIEKVHQHEKELTRTTNKIFQLEKELAEKDLTATKEQAERDEAVNAKFQHLQYDGKILGDKVTAVEAQLDLVSNIESAGTNNDISFHQKMNLTNCLTNF